MDQLKQSGAGEDFSGKIWKLLLGIFFWIIMNRLLIAWQLTAAQSIHTSAKDWSAQWKCPGRGADGSCIFRMLCFPEIREVQRRYLSADLFSRKS